MSIPLYLDEDVDAFLATLLTADGHDVLTTKDAGRAAQGISDHAQLAYASAQGRAIFTHNIRDFQRLSREWGVAQKSHAGIILSHRRPVQRLRERFPAFFDRYPNGMANICDYL